MYLFCFVSHPTLHFYFCCNINLWDKLGCVILTCSKLILVLPNYNSIMASQELLHFSLLLLILGKNLMCIFCLNSALAKLLLSKIFAIKRCELVGAHFRVLLFVEVTTNYHFCHYWSSHWRTSKKLLRNLSLTTIILSPPTYITVSHQFISTSVSLQAIWAKPKSLCYHTE